jgi:hypothetical protein
VVILRFRTRFTHLKGRLLHLTKLGVFPEGISSGDYQQLYEQLASSERIIDALEAADRPVLVKDERGDISNMGRGPVGPATILPQGKELHDRRDVITVSAELIYGAEVMTAGRGQVICSHLRLINAFRILWLS